MSDLEGHLHSSEGMISEEIKSRIEEYRRLVQKSQNLVRGPETSAAVSESFVDSLTEKEMNNIRDKVFSCWETTKTQQKYGEAVETSKVSRLQDTQPTTQSEEAVISFEDAKSDEVAKPLVQRYDIEKLIEAELKDIGNSKDAKDDSRPSTHQEKLTGIESMDFTEIQKNADLLRISGLESSLRTFFVLNTTDVLAVLLRIYDSSSVGSTERAVTYLAGSSDTKDLSSPHVQEFRKHLVDQMKIIFERLATIHSSGTHRAPENVESSDSSTSTKDSSSSGLTHSDITTPSVIPSLSQPSTLSFYPDPSTSVSRSVDDTTISSRPLSATSDSNDSSPSGLLNDPVIDMACAQPKTPDSSSSEESTSNATTNTSSVTISEETDTLSEISSLTTDPRLSVSSSRDVYQRSSVSSLSADNRASLSSLRDTDNVHQMLSEKLSDDAFVTPPLDAIAVVSPRVVDPADNAQNSRRRLRRSSKEEDKSEAKKPAL